MSGLEFQCPIIDSVCSCPFPSTIATATNCALSGDDVIANLGYAGVNDGLYAGILIIIIVVYRLAMWGVLVWRKRWLRTQGEILPFLLSFWLDLHDLFLRLQVYCVASLALSIDLFMCLSFNTRSHRAVLSCSEISLTLPSQIGQPFSPSEHYYPSNLLHHNKINCRNIRKQTGNESGYRPQLSGDSTPMQNRIDKK